MGPTEGYIILPVKYSYLGSALIINITIGSAIIEDREYWVIDPFFLPIPFYIKECSYFDNMYVGRSFNQTQLYELTWTKVEKTVLETFVTERYPLPNPQEPSFIYEEHVLTSDSSIGETMPGIIASVILSLFNEAKNKILGSVAGQLGEWLARVTDVNYMVFNAYHSTFYASIKVIRSNIYEDYNAYIKIYKYTASILAHASRNYTPLMLKYDVIVDDSLLDYGGSGMHQEEISDNPFTIVAKDYAYAESTSYNISRSWFKYFVLVNDSVELSLDIAFDYSLYYDICTDGYVYLKAFVKIYSADSLIHSDTITLFEKQYSESPPDTFIPTARGEVSGDKTYSYAVILEPGIYYIVIEVKAYAESHYGYTYIDAYSNNHGVDLSLDIDLS